MKNHGRTLPALRRGVPSFPLSDLPFLGPGGHPLPTTTTATALHIADVVAAVVSSFIFQIHPWGVFHPPSRWRGHNPYLPANPPMRKRAKHAPQGAKLTFRPQGERSGPIHAPRTQRGINPLAALPPETPKAPIIPTSTEQHNQRHHSSQPIMVSPAPLTAAASVRGEPPATKPSGTPAAATTTPPATGGVAAPAMDEENSLGAAAAALFSSSAEKMSEYFRNLSPGRKARLAAAMTEPAEAVPVQHREHGGGPAPELPTLVQPTPHQHAFEQAAPPSYAAAAANAWGGQAMASNGDDSSEDDDVHLLLPPPPTGKQPAGSYSRRRRQQTKKTK